MASKKVNIVDNTNEVSVTNSNNKIEIVNTNTPSNIEVTQRTTTLVQVNAAGPKGDRGPVGPVGPSVSFDSGSYVTTGSFNSFTSSIQTEVDSLTSKTGSYATTGSNNFIGNQVITGSLIVSSSSTFTNIGPAIFSGSVDITGSLNLDGPFTITGSIESPNSITFNTASTDADAIARLKWNETEGTLDLGMGGGLATLQIGQELYYPKVVNKSGENLINGTLVMVDPAQPAQGNRLRVIRAVTDGTYPSELIVGPLTEDVDNNQEGFATWFGYVRNLNQTDLENNGVKSPTDNWEEGSILYTNPNLDGGYTSSMQSAPAGKSSIAAVTAVNGQNITLLVRPKLDTNVGNLHDVTDLTTTSSYGDLFIKSGNVWTTSKILSGSYSLSGSLTLSGNISSSGIVYGTTGSFSYLQGNSPITVGDSVTFQQPISASSLTSNNNSIFLGFDEANLNNNYIYIEDGGDLFILGYGGGVEIGSGDGYQINVYDTMEFTTPSQTSLILNDLYAVFQVPITTTNVTASGDISASGTITATSASFTHISGTISNIIWTVDFTDGELNTTLYAPYNLSIDSIDNVYNSPTSSISSSGSPYTLGNAITTGEPIDITVSTGSVINLNITR